ncbi:MAG: TIGR00730 family Rossman fold protein [Actinomycetia bacterium]|nr:TIGR00730 family Rossman fold protein [Actinomycetes bacterium]
MASRRPSTGDPDLDRRVRDIVAEVGTARNDDLIRELVTTALLMDQEDIDRLDLKIASRALVEMREAWHVFRPWDTRPKVAIFGSARTASDDPAYQQAHDFGARIAERGWMVLTGAGPGIMTAGIEGAGRENSFGINIELPFEPEASPAIMGDEKLINFRYFFTRKLSFVKESDAFVLLPGGFGTMDEAFELLTLVQTGRTTPVPIVLLESPGATYWQKWIEFAHDELLDNGMINEADLGLVCRTDSIDDAVEEICRFYGTYHSIRFVAGRLVFRLEREISDDELATLNRDFADIVTGGQIERTEASAAERSDDDVPGLPRIVLSFDNRSFSRLRHLIDALNAGGPTPEHPRSDLPHHVVPGLGAGPE